MLHCCNAKQRHPRDTALRCHVFRRFAVRDHAYQAHPAGEWPTAASCPARWGRFRRGVASKPNLDAGGRVQGVRVLESPTALMLRSGAGNFKYSDPLNFGAERLRMGDTAERCHQMCGVTRCGCCLLTARSCSTGFAQKARSPAESLRVSTPRQNRPPENPSAFALATAPQPLCILCLAPYPNRGPPTGSAEEP